MSNDFTFNLVEQPWLPCIDQDGAARTLNLRDIFAQAHELKSLVGDTPLITAALLRILLAVAHRVYGPANEEEWVVLWDAEAFKMGAVNAYLDRWQHRFDLFGIERPFFQAPDPRVKPKSVINLRHDRASGNNATLFDHHTEQMGEALTPAEAARTLIAAQAYGLAGLSGIEQKFTDGTCAGGILFIVEGDSLRQTLLLNMIPYPPHNDLFAVHDAKDVPTWEMDDPFRPQRTQPLGYLDYLTWQNRRILLIPESSEARVVVKQMTMGPALRLDPLPLDPMKNYRMDDPKIGPIATSFSENRVLWRDSATLFAFNPDQTSTTRPPANLRWLHWLIREMGAPDAHRVYRTLALGMAKKQAKVFFFREERLPLPLAYLTDERLVESLAGALRQTSIVAFDLVQAARLMGMYIHLPQVEDSGWQKQWQGLNVNTKNEITDWITHTAVEKNYWSSLEIPFYSLVVDLVEKPEQALRAWNQEMRYAAEVAFDQAAQFAGSDGRSIKAVVRSRGYLEYRLREVITVD